MNEQVIENKKSARTVIGKVVSNKMDKTLVVQVEHKVRHPVYNKYVRRFSKMYAHDEQNTGCIGDKVLIQESRPLSKTKHWVLVQVLEKAIQDEIVG
ncbi:MAG: 30S ribosomal protein S17 [Gammaproteobacteria bacterium RIFCSPHIGHO2_12_FULL_41_20]|nr:MAG: 30S ribosomal protein S17 [Gammaproteobacteria bacterium RIFCSPHIGHO2_12_FULL_41_20]